MQIARPSRQTLFAALAVLLAAAVFMWRAFVNGYPLVHYDTGTYIAACFQHFVPVDRPLTYAFFIRHISLAATLWLPVIVQSILMSWVIFLCFRYVITIRRALFWYAIAVVTLAFTTGLSVNTAQLIADVFCPVMILSMALLFFTELPRLVRITLFCLLVFSISVHLSNYPLFCAMSGLVLLFWLIRRKKVSTLISFRKIAFVSVTLPLAILFTMVINHKERPEEWRFNPGAGHVMTVSKLINAGIMDQYLSENCPTKHYTLCDYRSHENNLMWDDSSSLNIYYGWKDKGWLRAKSEYDSIISDIFSESKYVRQFAALVLTEWKQQLVRFDIEYVLPQGPGSASDVNIMYSFPEEAEQYRSSKSAVNPENYIVANQIQYVTIAISALILFLLLFANMFRKFLTDKLAWFTWLLIVTIVLNALNVVAFAMVCERFQSRVIWFLPMLVLLIAADFIDNRRWKELFRST